ncbi:hypothetical protein EDEG_03571 [Edhazardia aedis USNM 41457]|uniref:TLC domain-containing protein n=1 Tax=Edhazardia aedis (strain USNM 41457) TaxID=1003232 RepID=J8ZQI1_EDHAE|nr:hypothetical protein EDEG_03571 [Edhazardia aedis USNM 41457]|eukprot:EJW01963.1 hypothetical protein EDEG_03571 [Edhazardia aedis USNM 41457]
MDFPGYFLASFLALLLVKFAVKSLARKIFIDNKIFSKKKESIKLQKTINSIHKLIVYFIFTIFEIFCLYDQKWAWDPFQYAEQWNNNEIPKKIKILYSSQATYYLISTFFMFFEPKYKDFYEMLCHHIITIYLISASMIVNLTKYGVIIMFLHDICDPFLEAAKILIYFSFKKSAEICFALFSLTFFANRGILYPMIVVIPMWVFHSFNVVNFCMKIILISLVILMFINYYWLYLIYLMVKNIFISDKNNKDTRDIRSEGND